MKKQIKKNPEECVCQCHTMPGGIHHPVACCGTCQFCGKERIKTSLLARHEEQCKKKKPTK